MTDIPLMPVSALAAAPWHQEVVAYTTASPINWVEGERIAGDYWILSVGGKRLGEVRLEPTPGERRVLLACRPDNFCGGRVHSTDQLFADVGKSDMFGFVGAGEKVIIIPKDGTARDGELRLQGSVLAFSYEHGVSIGQATLA